MSENIEYRASRKAVFVSMLAALGFLVAAYSGVLTIEFIPDGGPTVKLSKVPVFIVGFTLVLMFLPLVVDRLRWARLSTAEQRRRAHPAVLFLRVEVRPEMADSVETELSRVRGVRVEAKGSGWIKLALETHGELSEISSVIKSIKGISGVTRLIVD